MTNKEINNSSKNKNFNLKDKLITKSLQKVNENQGLELKAKLETHNFKQECVLS